MPALINRISDTVRNYMNEKYEAKDAPKDIYEKMKIEYLAALMGLLQILLTAVFDHRNIDAAVDELADKLKTNLRYNIPVGGKIH